MDRLSPRLLPAELVLGVPEIDLQHEALFARLIFLKNLCLKEKHLPASEAEALLQALRDHYDTEERLAAEMGEDFSAHRRLHEVMLLAVAKTLKEVVERRANIFSLLRYLDYWFERHIADEDRVFEQVVATRPAAVGRDSLNAMANQEEGLPA